MYVSRLVTSFLLLFIVAFAAYCPPQSNDRPITYDEIKEAFGRLVECCNDGCFPPELGKVADLEDPDAHRRLDQLIKHCHKYFSYPNLFRQKYHPKFSRGNDITLPNLNSIIATVSMEYDGVDCKAHFFFIKSNIGYYLEHKNDCILGIVAVSKVAKHPDCVAIRAIISKIARTTDLEVFQLFLEKKLPDPKLRPDVQAAILSASVGDNHEKILVGKASIDEYIGIAVRIEIKTSGWFAHIGTKNNKIFYHSDATGECFL